MTYPASFLAISFIVVLTFLHSGVVYWQERRVGSSHDASLKESAVVTVFFWGAAAIDYFAVVSKYA